jgi:hypothetical protein
MPSAPEVGSVLWNWHQSSLLSLDSSRLQDTVFSIREAAIQVLQAVAKEFGPDWTRDHIVPQVRCNAVATWGLGARIASSNVLSWRAA